MQDVVLVPCQVMAFVYLGSSFCGSFKLPHIGTQLAHLPLGEQLAPGAIVHFFYTGILMEPMNQLLKQSVEQSSN